MSQKEKTIITLQEYFDKGKKFVVPCYQRGYVWGKSRHAENKDEEDSVSYMLSSLIDGYTHDKQVFIQGVTVTERADTIELIDGQQRTTFFYLLMLYLKAPISPAGNPGIGINIEYTIRRDSQKFLESLKVLTRQDLCYHCQENPKEFHQDIYYFKKSIRIFDEKFKNYDSPRLESFTKYILNNVCFLYIDIPEEKAESVFKMMNGNKADMLPEDVLKAEILRLISLDNDDDTEAEKYEKDMLRSRYAREWDKWTYWWNRADVRTFYRVNTEKHPLYTLLYVYYNKAKDDKKAEEVNFENFRTICLTDRERTRQTFTKLRHLQKRFEDTFNDVDIETHLHNTVGAILCSIERIYKPIDFILDYFCDKINNIEMFYKICMMAAGKGDGWLTYSKIMNVSGGDSSDDKDVWTNATEIFQNVIASDDLYHSPSDANGYKEFAFRQLMLLNIEQDNYLGRAFNFDIHWDRSIEHIHAKSKVYKYDNNANMPVCAEKPYNHIQQAEIDANPEIYINETDLLNAGCTQHCIGNFALLYVNDNSKFSDHSFAEKKSILFDYENKVDMFSSRELLHTIKLFSMDKWGVKEIKENKEKVIKHLREFYGIQ